MALLFANHTATIYERSETADPVTKVVPIPDEAAGVLITCQIRPIRDRVVVDAEGVELVNPHEMMIEIEDINAVPYGARVVWTNTEQHFRIANKAALYMAEGDLADLNHATVEMELLEESEGAPSAWNLVDHEPEAP